jgi:hypothetical protein
MSRVRVLLLACLLAAVGLGIGSGAARAAGPWRGQVVDAENGQPIEGVVVVAVWERLSPGVVHQARAFHDVDEVVTDAEGRFVLPERELSPPNPFVTIDGPQLTMFKGGYGLWRFKGSRTSAWPQDTTERMRRWDQAMAEFGRGGAVFEIPQLKSKEERLKALPMSPNALLPRSRIPKLNEAVGRERAFLGLTR